jgi:tetratricopeptide (TPR) repeat protein
MAGWKCRLIYRRIWEYVDEQLPAAQKRAVEAHLDSCENCRQLVAKLRAEAAAAQLIQPLTPPADFAARVWQRIEALEAERSGRGARRAFSPARVGWVATALTILIIAAVYFANPVYRETVEPGRPTTITPSSIAKETPAVIANKPKPEAIKKAVTMAEAGAARAAVGNRHLPAKTVRVVKSAGIREIAKTKPIITPAPVAAENPLEVAAEYEQNGEMEDALIAYQEAADNPQDREAALFGVGRIYERMGLSISAIEAYDAAVFDNGNDAPESGRTEG